HVYTPTDGSWASQHLISTGNSIAGTQGLAGGAYSDLVTHAGTLPSMRDHLATADTPKDVADSEAEIQLESVWTLNQQARLTSAQLTYASEQDSRNQQADEEVAKSLDNQLQE